MTVSLLHSVAADGSFSAAGAAAWDAQHVFTQATDRLLGRTTAGVGATEEITVGSGLSLSAGTLTATGTSMVYPGAGIANSTGSAWDTSYTTTGSGTVVALATSPSFITPILGTPQSGNFSTGTFTWPTFNQNTTGTAANVTGTVAVGNGGTGAITLTGVLKGNGTSAFTAASAGTDYVAPGAITTSGLTMATARLLGRTTASTGAAEEISVGAGLTLSGGTLVNAGATSPIGGSDTQVQFNDGGVFAGNANFTFNKATNQIAIAAGTAAAPTLIPTGDTNTGVWFPAADTIAASTGGTERMRIDSSGNVGIGTSAPTTLLSVNGVASFGAGTAALPSVAAFGDLDTGMWFPAANTVAFSTGGSERMRIDSSGNVGIGTSSPALYAAKLAVYSTSGSSRLYLASAGTTASDIGEIFVAGGSYFSYFQQQGNGFAAFYGNAIALTYGTSAAGYIGFLTSGSERIRIASGGNVGIGTSSPTTLLSVNGVASFGAGAAATPSVAAFGDLNTGMWFPAADTVAWSTGGSERLRITSNGNVGLGTSTFGTSAATAFAIATGTAPTTGPADTIQIYSTDLSAGNTMLSLYTEGTVVNTNIVAATTHRIAIRVNGTVYYLLANTAA
jgi:hypothetical protein